MSLAVAGVWAVGVWDQTVWSDHGVWREDIMGTEITNSTATETPSNYVIDQRTGFKLRPGELVKDGYGILTSKKYYDGRHPQEFVRSVPETHKGSESPEQTDRFISTEYPSGVQVSDL